MAQCPSRYPALEAELGAPLAAGCSPAGGSNVGRCTQKGRSPTSHGAAKLLRLAPRPKATARSVSASPRLILVAEDEAIIAIELEDSLRAAGFAVAGPFATCAEAEDWLSNGEPDAAILDHALRDGTCDALVRELARRGVPTVIFTGHDARGEPLAEVSSACWIAKPIAFSALLDELRREMRRPRSVAPN
jgi:CheY-like chemotaxis protein